MSGTDCVVGSFRVCCELGGGQLVTAAAAAAAAAVCFWAVVGAAGTTVIVGVDFLYVNPQHAGIKFQ